MNKLPEYYCIIPEEKFYTIKKILGGFNYNWFYNPCNMSYYIWLDKYQFNKLNNYFLKKERGVKMIQERSNSLIEKAYGQIIDYKNEKVSYTIMSKIVKNVIVTLNDRSCAGFKIEAMKLSIILWLITEIELVKNRKG